MMIFPICLLFEICRMVWLLDDYYDVQHRAYIMSEKKQVIIILVITLKFVFSSNRGSVGNTLTCLFAVAFTSKDSVSWGIVECHAL